MESPWNDASLDEWRCPTCASMAYTPKNQEVIMLKCATCPGLVWMEQLFSMEEVIDGEEDTE